MEFLKSFTDFTVTFDITNFYTTSVICDMYITYCSIRRQEQVLKTFTVTTLTLIYIKISYLQYVPEQKALVFLTVILF